MKDRNVYAGFRKLGASYCPSLKEHYLRRLCVPERPRAAGTAHALVGLFTHVHVGTDVYTRLVVQPMGPRASRFQSA